MTRVEVIYIEGRRDTYTEESIVRDYGTMTVKQLKEYLNNFNDSTPVMINNDDGYTFGEINEDSIRVGYFTPEDDDEEVEFDEDEEFENAVDELDELDLDETAYEHYRSILFDMHYNDMVSAKNGDTGYESFDAVLEDARKCAEKNEEQEDED